MTQSRWQRGFAAVLLLAVAGPLGCATVPYTNRSQFIVLSESQDLQLGAAAFQEVLKQERVVRDPQIVDPVVEVGRRIAAVADKPDYKWEFAVIDDPKQANAFCLPGGKVGVYTGLFPIARDEAGLAAVIGHEVAHAIARHGAERVSQGMAMQIVGVGVAVAASGASPVTQQAIMQAYGLGSQVGVALPFGRSQETEADRIGVILMAKAGYDPEAAIGLWQRMEQYSRGGAPPEWLSTHPHPSTRIADLRKWVPDAMAYYRPVGDQQFALLPPIPGAPGPSASAAGDSPRRQLRAR
jgi:predicted Zn-dependent protease